MKLNKILIFSLTLFLFSSCAYSRKQNEPAQPPAPTYTLPTVSMPINPVIEDVIYFNVKEWKKDMDLFMRIGDSLQFIRYNGAMQGFNVRKEMFPLEILFSLNEETPNYKTTKIRLDYYQNGQVFDVSLRKKLNESTEKVILLFVNLFNSAYDYYNTGNLAAFRNIQPGAFYYLTEAFDEFPALETEEMMKIVDLVNKNIKLPKNDIIDIVRTGVSIANSFYVKKTAGNRMTQYEETQLKEQLTNDFTQLWWSIFDLIKNNMDSPKGEKQVLSEATRKTVMLIVDIFNSAYKYYQNEDIDAFKNIQPGAFYYVFDAVNELPKLETAEVVEIVNLVNQNLQLPQSEITNLVQRSINIIKNVYIQKAGKKLSVKEQTKIREELTNDFTKLWWDIFDMLKTKKNMR